MLMDVNEELVSFLEREVAPEAKRIVCLWILFLLETWVENSTVCAKIILSSPCYFNSAPKAIKDLCCMVR